MEKKTKPVWKFNFDALPPEYIGACFNRDGTAWAWTVKPEIKGSAKRPNDLKWRGPVVGEGFLCLGTIGPDVDKTKWQESWLDRK